ncbi:MAG: DUF4294 domain-containing protein [Rikenellaceae bacterium]
MGQNRSKGYWHQKATIENGDTLITVDILPVYKYTRGIDQRRYARLIRSVKRVYPLAKIAREQMADMESVLISLPTKKEQKEYVNQVYDNIKDEYTPHIRRMTITDGRILLRLIERETEFTAYNILFDFRGRFIAGFWQGISRIFGHNLKSKFGEEDEDEIIEQIIIYYEAGLL